MKRDDFITGKLPPQAIEVEEAVLGALMLEKDAYTSVAGIIDSQSFYKDEHQKIFKVVKDLAAKDKPVDLLLVVQELKARNQLDEIGGPTFIAQLARRVASSAHIEHHARIIAQAFYQREIIRRSSEMIKHAYEGEDIDVLESLWRSYGDQLSDVCSIGNEGIHIKDVLKNTLAEMEADCVKAREGKLVGITTGFRLLDTLTGGWRPAALTILAARPKVGKSSVALHFAVHAAKAGFWVNFFSLEMRSEDLVRIQIAAETGIYRSSVRDGNITEKDWKTIHEKAVPSIEKMPFIFSDISGLTISELRGIVRKNRKNGRCDLVIVDYLQLVNGSNKELREQQIAEITRTLKTTAKNENIPIIALSQLNRIDETDEPRLSNLRESGAIEQDADNVIFLHRPDPEGLPDVIRLSVAKQRNGREDKWDIFTNKDRTLFAETPFNHSPEPTIKHAYNNPDAHIEPNNSPF